MAHVFLLPFAMLFLGGVQFVQCALHGAAQIVLHADLSLTDGVLDALGLGGAVSLDDRLLCAQEGCAAVLLAVHLAVSYTHLALHFAPYQASSSPLRVARPANGASHPGCGAKRLRG